jgi:hypothetical protein
LPIWGAAALRPYQMSLLAALLYTDLPS